MSMVFDLRTCDAAYKFVLDFLDMSGEDFIMNYVVECSSDIEKFWEQHFDAIDTIDIKNLKIMAFHVTTSSDECAEIRANGLKNLQKVLSENTALSRALKNHGVVFDIPRRKMKYNHQEIDIDYERYRDTDNLSEREEEIEKIAHRVFYDHCVDGFMVRDNIFTYSTIHKYPEFLLKIEDAFPELQALVSDWIQVSKPYRVDFYAYYPQLHDFTFDFGEKQYSPHDIYQELTYEQSIKKWMLSKAICRSSDRLGDVPLYVEDDVDIPPEQIVSCTPILEENNN